MQASIALCSWQHRPVSGCAGIDLLRAGSSIKQHGFPFFAPRILIGLGKRVEIGGSGGGIVHPGAQQLAAVDHVDCETAVFVLVREVAPQSVLGPQRREAP